jgi:hypothetical protein
MPCAVTRSRTQLCRIARAAHSPGRRHQACSFISVCYPWMKPGRCDREKKYTQLGDVHGVCAASKAVSMGTSPGYFCVIDKRMPAQLCLSLQGMALAAVWPHHPCEVPASPWSILSLCSHPRGAWRKYVLQRTSRA